jgi:hypothetical protein
MELRRQFELLRLDKKFLDDYGLPWETVVDGSQWVLIHKFPTPAGYDHSHVTVAVRLETGYPDVQLDMVYFHPGLARKDSQQIVATEATQALDGKPFQRWSRHRTPQNPWKPERDDLGTHIFLIEDWLEREFEKCPPR